MSLIVIVEDHAVMAETMAEYLQRKLNAEVVIVQSAEAALHEVPDLEADLVLIDVSLPKMNGIDLIAELRKRVRDLPCLAVSGHVEPNYVRRAFKAGVQGYVEKGDPDSLVEAVQRVLAGETYLDTNVVDQLE